MKSIDTPTDARQKRTLLWVVAISALALVFDGYDLVVYGTVVSTLLRDPSQIGALDPVQAGLLGSYALMGVMVGALLAGAVGDFFGRRKIMIINIAWFSLGMAATAMTTNTTAFGLMRFLTGIGVGALVATAGAMIAEFAPAGRRNFYNALVYSGVPTGALVASLLAIVLSDSIGWRGLFLIGALPILFLFPIAIVKLPESPKWLFARGRVSEAEALSIQTGIPMLPDGGTDSAAAPSTQIGQRSGFAGLASKQFLIPTVLLGMMSFSGLLLTYGLNTKRLRQELLASLSRDAECRCRNRRARRIPRRRQVRSQADRVFHIRSGDPVACPHYYSAPPGSAAHFDRYCGDGHPWHASSYLRLRFELLHDVSSSRWSGMVRWFRASGRHLGPPSWWTPDRRRRREQRGILRLRGRRTIRCTLYCVCSPTRRARSVSVIRFSADAR
jgi:MFS family permease